MAGDTTRVIGAGLKATVTGQPMDPDLQMFSVLGRSGTSTSEALGGMVTGLITAPFAVGYNGMTAVMNGDQEGLGRALGEGSLLLVGGKQGGLDRVAITAEDVGNAGAFGQRGSIGVGMRPLFKNQAPELLDAELGAARSVGVKPIRFGDPEFDVAVNQGTVKFVVTESGELLIAPHSVGGVEISHAVLSNGRPVLSAGQADIAAANGTYVGINITPHSGHFLNGATVGESASALDVGTAAFGRIGIKF